MKLPEPDTHCFDMDTDTNVWSYSREQMIELRKATIEECALMCETCLIKSTSVLKSHLVAQGNAAIYDCMNAIRRMEK